MKSLKMRLIRTAAATVAVGIISLVGGIPPASARTNFNGNDCQTYYQVWGYSSPSDCVQAVVGGKTKHR